jgi:hypothetical protein
METGSYNYRLENFKSKFPNLTDEGRKIFESCIGEIYFNGGLNKKDVEPFVNLCNSFAKYKSMAAINDPAVIESRKSIMDLMKNIASGMGLTIRRRYLNRVYKVVDHTIHYSRLHLITW